jgi:hypothetical protein
MARVQTEDLEERHNIVYHPTTSWFYDFLVKLYIYIYPIFSRGPAPADH